MVPGCRWGTGASKDIFEGVEVRLEAIDTPVRPAPGRHIIARASVPGGAGPQSAEVGGHRRRNDDLLGGTEVSRDDGQVVRVPKPADAVRHYRATAPVKPSSSRTARVGRRVFRRVPPARCRRCSTGARSQRRQAGRQGPPASSDRMSAAQRRVGPPPHGEVGAAGSFSSHRAGGSTLAFDRSRARRVIEGLKGRVSPGR